MMMMMMYTKSIQKKTSLFYEKIELISFLIIYIVNQFRILII